MADAHDVEGHQLGHEVRPGVDGGGQQSEDDLQREERHGHHEEWQGHLLGFVFHRCRSP